MTKPFKSFTLQSIPWCRLDLNAADSCWVSQTFLRFYGTQLFKPSSQWVSSCPTLILSISSQTILLMFILILFFHLSLCIPSDLFRWGFVTSFLCIGYCSTRVECSPTLLIGLSDLSLSLSSSLSKCRNNSNITSEFRNIHFGRGEGNIMNWPESNTILIFALRTLRAYGCKWQT